MVNDDVDLILGTHLPVLLRPNVDETKTYNALLTRSILSSLQGQRIKDILLLESMFIVFIGA
jgi:hypothetical protein